MIYRQDIEIYVDLYSPNFRQKSHTYYLDSLKRPGSRNGRKKTPALHSRGPDESVSERRLNLS